MEDAGPALRGGGAEAGPPGRAVVWRDPCSFYPELFSFCTLTFCLWPPVS